MKLAEHLKKDISNGLYDSVLNKIYCKKEPYEARERYIDLINGFCANFGSNRELSLFSAPGRTEIGGNHTDHQRGCVLAASVNLDVIAAVSLNSENLIRLQSEGYPLDIINLDELTPQMSEYNQAKALIKGVVAKFKEMGYQIRGFDAYTTSNVLKGSGLSSSAAFEVLIGNILNGLFANSSVSDVEIAKIGQYAENVYFGKPCGLMDQMASSVGAVVSIDFKDLENPIIEKIDFDFSKSSYALCIIDSGADHADLTDEYAAIPYEMKKVAQIFEKEVLRDVDETLFMENLPKVRERCGDRAILRTMHFYADNRRAILEAEALKKGDFERFLDLVKESGRSSYMYLQNVSVSGCSENQEVALVLALCDKILKNKGAFRVHGGGFAGTVQAFVPLSMLEEFKTRIEKAIGEKCCHVLSIRPIGGIRIE